MGAHVLLRLAFVYAVSTDLTHTVTLIGSGVASLSVTQDMAHQVHTESVHPPSGSATP